MESIYLGSTLDPDDSGLDSSWFESNPRLALASLKIAGFEQLLVNIDKLGVTGCEHVVQSVADTWIRERADALLLLRDEALL